MNIAAAAVNKRTVTVFTALIFMLAGIMSFRGLGQLEDPEFAVKTAVVTTTYPGARAEEVELEVTDRIELALQEMPQVKQLESFSRPGFSQIIVDIKPEYQSDDLPQVWDELRKKVRDVRESLPPGAGTPTVGDDFGDVYGFLLAIEGDGFTYAELESYMDAIKKELSLVDGVARVEPWGVQEQCIYLELSRARLTQLGLRPIDVKSTLSQQNLVVNSGSLDIQDQRLRFETTGEFRQPEDIGELFIRGGIFQEVDANRALLRVADIGDVRRGYVEPPIALMRFNGRPAVGLSISNLPGVNIVDLGTGLDRRIEELKPTLPYGIELHKVSWQSDQVDESIVGFIVSLAQAVAIVLAVLWLFMGLRTAFIVGVSGLIMTIVASFVFMSLMGIDLQRMSLGALIIAMGMMVDNAIVVTDGIVVRIQQGMDRVAAAVEAASQPAIPLLGATVIAVMAFYPIAASKESAGEYCASLFSVVAIALMVSWVLSVTVAPVMCIAMLPKPKTDGGDIYGGRFYALFRGGLGLAIRFRWVVVAVMIGILGVSAYAFRMVDQMFFPASSRPQFMIDYWAPEGTRVQQVADNVRTLEDHLLDDERVDAATTFIGMGPPRFYLPVDPESPNQSYGQVIVNVADYRDIDVMIRELQAWSREHAPEALVVMRKYGLGPSETWPVEARISGPAVANPAVLRALGDEGMAIMGASPHAVAVRTNWRQQTRKVVADYDQVNARWTSVEREDIANTLRRTYDGIPIGQFRERDKLLPIIARMNEQERREAALDLGVAQVRPLYQSSSIPLTQVTRSIAIEVEDPMVWRWDRRRAITIQAVPRGLATELRADVMEGIEAMELPAGYVLEWDGEYLSSKDAQQSLIPGMIPAGVIVALIVVGLFNAYRPPLVILLTIPFALIGVTVGLLAANQPFGFVALLGAMSLIGMMIKNAIVLLDQVNIEKDAGKSPYDAIVAAAVSRLRPVVLAAATTVLGVIPLLGDVFWVSMAVTIMFGLAFGTVLTMVVLPVLYAILFRIPARS